MAINTTPLADDPYYEALMEALRERNKASSALLKHASSPTGGGTLGEGLVKVANGAIGGFLEGKAERDKMAAANAQQEMARKNVTEALTGTGSGSGSATRTSGGGGFTPASSGPAAPVATFAATNPANAPPMVMPAAIAGGDMSADPSLGGKFGLNGPVGIMPASPVAVADAVPPPASPPVPTGRDAVSEAILGGDPSVAPPPVTPPGGEAPAVAAPAVPVNPEPSSPRAAVAEALLPPVQPEPTPRAPQAPRVRVASLDPTIGIGSQPVPNSPFAPKMLPDDATSQDFASVRPNVTPEAPPVQPENRDSLMKGVYDSFRNAGYSHDGALHLTAEVGREGAFSPANVFGSHTDPYNKKTNTGFMSWQGSRSDNLLAELRSQGLVTGDGKLVQDQKTLDAMAKFARKEMESEPKNAQLAKMLSTDGFDATDATNRLGRDFIKWRIDDPRYRDDGLNRRGEYFDRIAGMTRSGAGQPVRVASNDPTIGVGSVPASTAEQPQPVRTAEGGNVAPSATRPNTRTDADPSGRPSLPPIPSVEERVNNFANRRASALAGMNHSDPIVRGNAIRQGQALQAEIIAAQQAYQSERKERDLAVYGQEGQNYRQRETIGAENMRHGQRLELDERKHGLDTTKYGLDERKFKAEEAKTERERQANAWEPLITPDQRAMYGIPSTDKRPYRANRFGQLEVTAGDTGTAPISVPKGNTLYDPTSREPLFTANDPDSAKKDETELRKEVQQLPSYKNYSQALPIYKSMYDTAGRNTKASDLNLIYGLGKIMDPGSVVREGEMVMANNTQGIQERLNGLIASINGGAMLQPETRRSLMTEAHSRMRSYEDVFAQETGHVRDIATRGKLNVENIIGPFERSAPWEPARTTNPPAPGPQARPDEAARASPSIEDLRRERERRAGGTR